SVFAGYRGDAVGVGCVDPCGDEALALRPVLRLDPTQRALGAGEVVVAHDHGLEEVATSGDLGDGVTDTARPHEEDSHGNEASGHGARPGARRGPPLGIAPG